MMVWLSENEVRRGTYDQILFGNTSTTRTAKREFMLPELLTAPEPSNLFCDVVQV